MTTVYLDTEFTDLDKPLLLSVGMVSWDGQEHYVELDPMLPGNERVFSTASEFTRHGGVLDQWGMVPGAAAAAPDMAERTAAWLRKIASLAGGSVQIAYDYPADFELLVQVLRTAMSWPDWKRSVSPLQLTDMVGTFEAGLASDYAFESLRRRGFARHHALADALALRATHLSILAGRRVQP